MINRPVPMIPEPAPDLAFLVGDTGLEPVTSSVSGKRASQTAPIAHAVVLVEVETGFEPVWTALQAVASPLGHSTMVGNHESSLERMTRFELATLTLAR